MASATKSFSFEPVAGGAFSAAPRQAGKTVFVDLDDKPAKAQVVRDGFQVPSVRPDIRRVEQLLGDLQIQPPARLPRVITQSIAAGIKVGPGTVVDLVLAPKEDVPLKIFDDIHRDAAELSVEAVLSKVEADSQLERLVLKYDNADAVPEADRTLISGKMKSSVGLTVDDSDPEINFTKSFNTLRAVLAFK